MVMVKMKAQYVVKSNYPSQYMFAIHKIQLTRVATIAASSQPGDFVMRNRTQRRRPTASHAQMTSVMDKMKTILPNVISSSIWAIETMLSVKDHVKWGLDRNQDV